MLGDDPAKRRVADDLPGLWRAAHDHFHDRPDITGAQLHGHVVELLTASGWSHPTSHAGHLVGEFPHERINGDEIDCYIAPGNDPPMRRFDASGRPCHWILEIHAVDAGRGFGGFYEQLLDI